jgi:release factor glutamine methyltransferase
MTQRTDAWTIRRLLEWTGGFFQRKDVDSPRLAAELLLAHVLSTPRIKLYTEHDRELQPDQLAKYRELVARAAEHEPIAYLTGTAHFFNLQFHVTRDVLIPRPDTETIVEHVLQQARFNAGLEKPRIMDLCTGSGCIAAAVAHNLKNASVLAIDNSEPALAIAAKNVETLGLADRVVLAHGDLYGPLEKQITASPFDMIVSNPPYIPSANIEQLDRNVRDYEPRQALDGGPDGLAIIRRIIDGGPPRLLPGGRLYVEIQFDQCDAVKPLAEAAGFGEVKILRDQAGNDRVLHARKPSA